MLAGLNRLATTIDLSYPEACLDAVRTGMPRPRVRFQLRSLLLFIVLLSLFLGRRNYVNQREQRIGSSLQEMGAQIRVSEHPSLSAWLLGPAREVQEVHFLGPRMGDEHVESVARTAAQLSGLRRMTFAETRISRQGEHELRERLPRVEITIFTPVLSPPSFSPER
jgi:hypothetical protein